MLFFRGSYYLDHYGVRACIRECLENYIPYDTRSHTRRNTAEITAKVKQIVQQIEATGELSYLKGALDLLSRNEFHWSASRLKQRYVDRMDDFPRYFTCDHCEAIAKKQDSWVVELEHTVVCTDCVRDEAAFAYVEQLDQLWPIHAVAPIYTSFVDRLHQAQTGYYPNNNFALVDTAREHNLTYIYDSVRGNYYCPTRVAEQVIDDQSQYYAEEEDNDRYSDDEPSGDDPRHGIGDYHSCKGVLKHLPSLYDAHKRPLNLGMELEIEVDTDDSVREAAEAFRETFNAAGYGLYCGTEHDGSLDHGFEIVTTWTGLDVHEAVLKTIKTIDTAGCSSHNTKTCGLHVHIDKANMTIAHAIRLVEFMHSTETRALVKAVARRYGTGYCEIVDKTGTKKDTARHWRLAWTTLRPPSERVAMLNSFTRVNDWSAIIAPSRYEAVNFCNNRTIEFRIFKGSLKFETIMACLEFTRAVWLFTENNGPLTTDAFLAFIQQPQNKNETRYLRSLLKLKNWDVKAYPRELEVPLTTRLTRRKKLECVS